MPTLNTEWKEALVHVLALASRLEDEGQYNIAKVARAAADSLSRRAAFQVAVPADKDQLAADVERAAAELAALDVDDALVAAFRRGAAALAEGRLPLVSEFPHPYVCRTCGHLTFSEPAGPCPTCGAWAGAYQRFMPNYWFDAYEPFTALLRLRQTPLEAAALLEGLPEAVLDQSPAEGSWAMRNVISHMRDAQGVLDFRVDLFLKEEQPVLESKAVWAWATSEAGRPATAREIFETYRASRESTLRKLEGVPLAHWWRTGLHQEFGTLTLRQQVSYFAAHEITHLGQIVLLRRRFAERR